MVVYNELIAITAGAGLIGFAQFLGVLLRRKAVDSEGWAAFFGVTGLLLLALGLHLTVTWPYQEPGFEYYNIAFGQPAAAFGALLLVAAVYLWRSRSLFAGDQEIARETALRAFRPVSIFVGAVGLAMGVLAITFVRFQLGAAPPEEPITGRFGHLPWIEALFLGGLWGVIALGALLFAISYLAGRPGLLRWSAWAFLLGGVALLLFGAINFYTHIGMYTNFAYDTNYRW
ncbi:DUF981 family protein [Georgenia sp. Z1491]|uniref:DUF981 family protein n=1 Tax=Georgenia sp. Z1491 TaxID=3416707 RepID=UPI003CEC37AB